MSSRHKHILGLGAGFGLALLAACGGQPDVGSFESPSTSGKSGGTGPIAKGADSAQPASDLAACATSTAAAQPEPVTLVFVYDRSGSMLDDGKWEAASAAMKAFFGGAAASGISASLTFFPNGYDFCATSSYSNPAVPLTRLPSATFGAALDAADPGMGTPTYSALSGALAYAKQLQQGAQAKVAVVMVTDGEPMGCDDEDDPSYAANAARAAAATIPTYVVGVGDDLAALDSIAAAGGTTSAFLVSVGNPTKTQQELSAAIDRIRSSALSCDYTIPAPPSGETFDRAKVNVEFTPASGAPTSLSYNATCAGGEGWRYDDPANPTRVLTCDSTCGAIKAGSGRVDIVFGCATKGGVVN